MKAVVVNKNVIESSIIAGIFASAPMTTQKRNSTAIAVLRSPLVHWKQKGYNR
jgi:hypothetical protein